MVKVNLYIYIYIYVCVCVCVCVCKMKKITLKTFYYIKKVVTYKPVDQDKTLNKLSHLLMSASLLNFISLKKYTTV